MIRAEICCGILPAYYVDHTRRDVTYYRLPSHPVWNITAACRKDAYITKAAKEFISLLIISIVFNNMPFLPRPFSGKTHCKILPSDTE